MRILEMTATFGKLEQQTLSLRPGLNIISAPNEWGKSTWCAFLCAMLYGIDTRARSTQDRLADKEKYLPWSGKPMEGSLRLEYDGLDLTIQRRTKGRIPLGEFQAFETATGLPVEGLTAENCGLTLLGVEKSVFQRTGFVRLSDLPVTQDEALRRRLHSLVTTGDDTASGDVLATKLRELKNRCRYNRSGLIPEVKAQVQTLQGQLEEQKALTNQKNRLTVEIAEAQQEQVALENHRRALAYAEAQEDQRKVAEAQDAADEARTALENAVERCKTYPGKGELLAKIAQAELLSDQIEEQQSLRAPSLLPLVLAWVAAAGVLLAGLLRFGLPVILVGAGLLAAAGLWTAKRHADLRRREADLESLIQRSNQLEDAVAQWKRQVEDWEELTQIRSQEERARDHLQTLKTMARHADPPQLPDELELSLKQTLALLGENESFLRTSQLQLAQCTGRMSNLPDADALEAQLCAAVIRLDALEDTYRSLNYAQKALESAMQEMQRRFAPQITRRAGEFLTRLTGGKYTRLTIDEDLQVQAASPTEPTLRPSQWRSEGTVDQIYLALRLSVWEALTPEAPLILDDAFARFDPDRLKSALSLLRELGRKKQILLFTCQDREKRL